MQPLDPDTLRVLHAIADAGDDGITSAAIAILAAESNDRRFALACNNSTAVAMRVMPLERRVLVVSVGTPKRMFATMRGLDVAAGGAQCRECGCTDSDACEEICGWVEADLCSSCVPVTA